MYVCIFTYICKYIYTHMCMYIYMSIRVSSPKMFSNAAVCIAATRCDTVTSALDDEMRGDM